MVTPATDPQSQKPKQRVPLGKVKLWTEAEIEKLAQVTPAELEEIKGNLDPEIAALLEAPPVQEPPP